MAHIKFDYSKVLDKFVAPHEVDNLQAQVTVADEMAERTQSARRYAGAGETLRDGMILSA